MKKSLITLLLIVVFLVAAVTVALLGNDASAKGGSVTAPPQIDESPIAASLLAGIHVTQEGTEKLETPEPVTIPKIATAYDIELIARTIWGEAEVVKSTAERAAVAWCILNRVDDSGKPIESVILAPHQFCCREDGNVPAWAVELAEDVVERWERERAGETNVGRTIPADYLYFVGDGWRNYFSIEWKSTEYWDWSMPNPYEN